MIALIAALAVTLPLTVKPYQAVTIPKRAEIVYVQPIGTREHLKLTTDTVPGFYSYKNRSGQIIAELHNRQLADWSNRTLIVKIGY